MDCGDNPKRCNRLNGLRLPAQANALGQVAGGSEELSTESAAFGGQLATAVTVQMLHGQSGGQEGKWIGDGITKSASFDPSSVRWIPPVYSARREADFAMLSPIQLLPEVTQNYSRVAPHKRVYRDLAIRAGC
jgi:hypothetical protein